MDVELWRDIVKTFHDHETAGHPGEIGTYNAIQEDCTLPHLLRRSLADSRKQKLQKMIMWHMGPLSLLESMDSVDSGGLDPDSTWKSCQLRWPQYIYTCLTPKPNPNTNLNPNPNPNSNPQQWFGCWSPAESGGFHRTPASKVVQKEALGNFDVESTGVCRSMWGSVRGVRALDQVEFQGGYQR